MLRTYPDTRRSSTVTHDEEFNARLPSAAANELTQRITSWLMGVQPLDCSHDSVPSSTRTRNRQPSKPYSRPDNLKQPHRRITSSNIHLNVVAPDLCNPWTTQEPPATILYTIQQNLPEYRIPAHIQMRGLNDLPERHHNPLVTHYPDDLREEYCRMVFLYNSLEEKRHQIENGWISRRTPVTAMQDIMDIAASIRRVVDSAQYIVDFAIECGIDVDFYQIFSRYRCPPLRQGMQMSKARMLTEEGIEREM